MERILIASQTAADDQINYAAFMKQLMEMDEKVVHDDTQKLYAKLEETQKNFTKQLGPTDEVKDVDADNVSKQLADLETALETERGTIRCP